MLSVLRARGRAKREELPRLVMADAHALPFADHFFDRVFHVGALGSYRDPARALAEMARVAVPGSPIVAVDEQLDPARADNLLARAFFRLVTFYEARPHCPVEALPEGATDVLEEQLSRFFYCLRFRMPVTSEAAAPEEL
jgi:ubiquinone/menaquinone biosynthesis C-methylase UbiE